MQRTISLVVSGGRAVIAVYPGRLDIEHQHWIGFAGDQPVRLAGGGMNLVLNCRVAVNQTDSRQRGYEARFQEYSYRVLDQDHRELLAYHYHPTGESWCTYPHLHVAGTGDVFSGKAHLATGWVSLPTVIRMLIEDPAIPVVSLRPDWPRVLDAAEATPDS